MVFSPTDAEPCQIMFCGIQTQIATAECFSLLSRICIPSLATLVRTECIAWFGSNCGGGANAASSRPSAVNECTVATKGGRNRNAQGSKRNMRYHENHSHCFVWNCAKQFYAKCGASHILGPMMQLVKTG
jgi:hypothetical protein